MSPCLSYPCRIKCPDLLNNQSKKSGAAHNKGMRIPSCCPTNNAIKFFLQAIIILLSCRLLVQRVPTVTGGLYSSNSKTILEAASTNDSTGDHSTANKLVQPVEENSDVAATIDLDNKPCRVLVMNRVGDYHYELLESIALQYPIYWERHNRRCNRQESPIVVDYYLHFSYKGYSNITEAWGWKDYFETYLQGQVVERHARHRNSTFQRNGGISMEDQRLIKYGDIVDASPSAIVDWKIYDINIETNCDMISKWEFFLLQSKNNYCVLHANKRKKVNDLHLHHQVCYLNPQHAPGCWFLPSDLPKFDLPVTTSSIRVCIGWKADKRREYRDTSLVVKVLEQLRPDNLLIVVIGRNARIPKQIRQGNQISHYVTLESSSRNFLDFQRTIAQCHALIPLCHPSGTSATYFMNATIGTPQGRLSGMISQAIGNRIPSIVHTAAVDIYRDLFTASFFEYNDTTDPTSFIRAFQQMIDYYNPKVQ